MTGYPIYLVQNSRTGEIVAAFEETGDADEFCRDMNEGVNAADRYFTSTVIVAAKVPA